MTRRGSAHTYVRSSALVLVLGAMGVSTAAAGQPSTPSDPAVPPPSQPTSESEPDTADPSASPPPEASAPEHTEIRWIILRVQGRPWDEVHGALAPRLPNATILPFDDDAFTTVGADLFAYVEIEAEPAPATDVGLTVVLSDHRAYLRRFESDPEHATRGIATTVANTIAAIEQEQIEADERVETIPRPEPAEPEPEPEPEPPPPEPQPEPEPEPEPAPPKPEPPPLELGVGLGVVGTFGLGPEGVQGSAALGGHARAAIRLRRGPIFDLGFRIGTLGDRGHRLWRNRLHFAAGYAHRGKRWGITALAGPTVEPWAIRSDSQQNQLWSLASTRASPLWGGMVAITPSFRWDLRSNVALQLGLRTELAASVQSSGDAIRVVDTSAGSPDQPPPLLFGLGGVELSTALELTVWIAPPATAGRRR